MALSYADGGPATRCTLTSLWSVLQHGAAIDPNRAAVLMPSQSKHHLEQLARPLASEAEKYLATSALEWTTRRMSIKYLAGIVISWFLPAPSNADGLTWSFADFYRATVRCAAFFEAHGIEPGATVLMIVPPSVEWTLMIWLCAFRCYTVATIDGELLKPENRQLLQEHIDELSPSVVVVASGEIAAEVDPCIAQHNTPFLGVSLEKLVDAPSVSGNTWVSIPDIANHPDTRNLSTEPSPDRLDRHAMIIYTSGSTGTRPKACVRTTGELLLVSLICEAIPPLHAPLTLINTKAYLAIAPCLLFAAWYSGNAAALAGGCFNPETTLETLGTGRPIGVNVLDGMLKALRTSERYSVERVKSVKFATCIGMTNTVAGLARCREVFPNATVVGGFGMTEAACMIGWVGGEAKKTPPSYMGIPSSGRVLTGAKVKIVDEDGKVVPRGSPGRLHLSGPMVFKGYLGGVAADCLYEEAGVPWFQTTDCAMMDADGYFYVLGRYNNMVMRNGTMVIPATIQNALEEEFEASVSIL